MNGSNEKLQILANERDRLRLELEFLLHFGRPICLPNNYGKEVPNEHTV